MEDDLCRTFMKAIRELPYNFPVNIHPPGFPPLQPSPSLWNTTAPGTRQTRTPETRDIPTHAPVAVVDLCCNCNINML